MIFVTNDDGIDAPGLIALAEALETLDEVYVVAPDRERSAVGMAITLHQPLRAKQVRTRAYAVDGTPVDCVDLALGTLLPEPPKLLVSGINQGQNLGADIHFFRHGWGGEKRNTRRDSVDCSFPRLRRTRGTS